MMESKKGFASFAEDLPARAVSPISSVFRPQSASSVRSTSRPGRSGLRFGSKSRPGESRPAHDVLSKPRLDYDVLSEPISCVTRETLQEDCAQNRLIVWAAVKRNLSTRIQQDDKLRCPLVGCHRQFLNHESMLRHLVECERLPSGEYWCHDHNRAERFDDMKCKHCLGHTSKRKKVISMAKQFFHSLGHKSKKDQNMAAYSEDPSLPPPPSYESIDVRQQIHNVTELPTNQIVEADSREVWALPSHVSADVAAIDPQALLVPSVPELSCTVQQPLVFGSWEQTVQTHATLPPSMTWDSSAALSMDNTSAKPSLQLTTFGLQGAGQLAPPKQVATSSRSKNLSPSSSLRSNNSNISNGTSLISPASNWSGAWSMGSGFDTGVTSPVDDMLADNNPFKRSASGRSTLGSEPNYLHHFFSELPADVPDTKGTGDISSDPLLFSFNETPSIGLDPPYASDIMLNEDLDLDLGLDDTRGSSAATSCSETYAMVTSASDALRAHVEESIQKIQLGGHNALGDQLCSMSASSIAAAGLRTLRALLNGNRPASAIDALCFIHLAYGFSMVTFEQDTVQLSLHHFLQSLSYANDIPPIDADIYRRLVYLIWQPPSDLADSQNLTRSLVAQGKAPESSFAGSLRLEGDTLLGAAMSFLDRLEISLVLGHLPTSPEELASQLYHEHVFDVIPDIMKTPFRFAAAVLIQQLEQDYGDAGGLTERLMSLQRSANDGEILSVRKLELELIKAGTDCMGPLRYYGEYIPDVRRQCNQIYSNHSSQPRLSFHNDGVSLIEDLMSLSGALDEGAIAATSYDPGDIDKFIEQLACGDFQQPQQERGVSEAGSSNAMTLDIFGMDFSDADIENNNDNSNHRLQIPDVITTNPFSRASSMAPSYKSETLRQSQFQSQTPSQSSSQSPFQPQSQSQPQAEPDAYYTQCKLCDYRPKGNPAWFRGSMGKHMKLQHSAEPPQIYRCPFPGCTSAYKNRQDNLRQHQIEKGHFVGGGGGGGEDADKGSKGTATVPRKRKKVAVDGEE